MQRAPGVQFGQYRLVERVGRGGMAEVWRAHQPALQRDVAIKFLLTDAANVPGYLDRFRREALSISRLDHPNILTIYDVGEQDGVPFMVIPFVSGGTLQNRLGRPWSVRDALTILGPLASALDYAHSQGIVHRDIKPSNVLLTGSGRVVLADFGIARVLAESTQYTSTGTLIGTPAYMSPEQVSGLPATAASDIYSLGIIAYEMLTGRRPFDGETPLAIALAHIQQPLPPPRSLNPAIAPGVEQVLSTILAKQPAARFQTAAAAVTALVEADRWAGPTGPAPVVTPPPPYQGSGASISNPPPYQGSGPPVSNPPPPYQGGTSGPGQPGVGAQSPGPVSYPSPGPYAAPTQQAGPPPYTPPPTWGQTATGAPYGQAAQPPYAQSPVPPYQAPFPGPPPYPTTALPPSGGPSILRSPLVLAAIVGLCLVGAMAVGLAIGNWWDDARPTPTPTPGRAVTPTSTAAVAVGTTTVATPTSASKPAAAPTPTPAPLTATPVPPAPVPPTLVPTATGAPRTPTPQLPRSVLKEDFGSGPRGFWVTKDASIETLVYDRQYVLKTLNPVDGGQFWSYLPNQTETDRDGGLVVDTIVSVNAADGASYIACRDQRIQGQSNHYSAAIDVSQASFQLAIWSGGERRDLVPWTRSAAIKANGEWNAVELRCIGSTISLGVNGETVAVVNDATYRTGSWGIGAWRFAGRSSTIEVRYDNLELRTP